jgi:uncharacterized protein (TIGR03083 family)
MHDQVDLSAIYREARVSLTSLVLQVPDAKTVPVPACPGWSVHDVLSHLVAVADDVEAGRLTGPPDDQQTASQVARRADVPTETVLREWETRSEFMERLLARATVWPAALDVLSHEHDVRGALDRSGRRDDPSVAASARWLLERLNPPVTMTVHCGDFTVVRGPEVADHVLELTTVPFETLPFRLGRRSRSQMADMAWMGDPEPVLNHLAIFGPSPCPIDE